MKIYVLGSNGMLGKYVSTYLSDIYDCVNLTRKDIDASEINSGNIDKSIEKLEIKNGDVIINCIGTIKPRVDELGDLNAIIVNSLFPRLLSNYCESKEIKLIHPTTDCVYTGLKGDYNENDNYDVSDVYGMSKALGETHNCTTIRTSIIGEESVNKRSLVEWVKSEKGNSIFGFTNHYWNGLTCLQFAKVCDKIISENIFWKGIRHIHSNKVSKYELVSIINEVYNLNIKIEKKKTELACDRSMSSVNDFSNFEIPNLTIQINEMKEFSDRIK